MTFDGNNEIEIAAKINGFDKTRYQVYLKIGDVEFANQRLSGKGSCGEEQPAVYLGKVYYDKDNTSSLPSSMKRNAQKQNAPFVQRVRNNVIIRDGEKVYRLNGFGL